MMDYPFNFEKIRGIFLERINRFIIQVKIGRKETLAYLPNPGRLWELLLRGREVILVPQKNKSRLPYVVLGCRRNSSYVLLHTHLTNKVIAKLIEEGRLEQYKEHMILKTEPSSHNNQRFDLLLKDISTGEKKFLEIKTCTLFGEKIAMFPDAETKRGKRHLLALAKLSDEGFKTEVLFVIMNPEIEYFLPAYHIDYEFSKAFFEVKDKVSLKAIAIDWDENFVYVKNIKPVEIPYDLLKKEMVEAGAYLLILELDKNIVLKLGDKERALSSGYYVYVGSAMRNLLNRIKRHQRKTKKLRWHIDHLTEKAKTITPILIRSSERLECSIADDLAKIAKFRVYNFGCSDCKCETHLFYFSDNPLKCSAFQDLLIKYRIDRLCSYLV